MNLIAILTLEQKESLVNELVEPNCYFNPIQDIDDNWIISKEEIDNSIYEKHNWIKSLPLSEYKSKPRLLSII